MIIVMNSLRLRTIRGVNPETKNLLESYFPKGGVKSRNHRPVHVHGPYSDFPHDPSANTLPVSLILAVRTVSNNRH